MIHCANYGVSSFDRICFFEREATYKSGRDAQEPAHDVYHSYSLLVREACLFDRPCTCLHDLVERGIDGTASGRIGIIEETSLDAFQKIVDIQGSACTRSE